MWHEPDAGSGFVDFPLFTQEGSDTYIRACFFIAGFPNGYG